MGLFQSDFRRDSLFIGVSEDSADEKSGKMKQLDSEI